MPAWRIKRNAVPGTYTAVWFKATRPDTYRLESSEFCGTEHARMAGAIVAMGTATYANWLALRGADEMLAQQGARLFREFGCSGCHPPTSTVHAPSLVGLHSRLVHLMEGTTVVADPQYLRDPDPASNEADRHRVSAGPFLDHPGPTNRLRSLRINLLQSPAIHENGFGTG